MLESTPGHIPALGAAVQPLAPDSSQLKEVAFERLDIPDDPIILDMPA